MMTKLRSSPSHASFFKEATIPLESNSYIFSKKTQNHFIRRRILLLSILIITFILIQFVTLPNRRKLKTYTTWCDDTCKLWKGEPEGTLSRNHPMEINLVISACFKHDYVDVFTKYINEARTVGANIAVTSISIISGCPFPENLPNDINTFQSRWEYPEMHFIEWFTAFIEAAATKELPTRNDETGAFLPNYSKENAFTVFLNGNSFQDAENIHTLEEILQLAVEIGVGCVSSPIDLLSSYHDTNVLKSFKSKGANEALSDHNNLGEWLDHLNSSSVLDKGIVPVCYGSSFALRSKDLLVNSEKYYPTILAMVTDFEKNYEKLEIKEFIERSLAALFAINLSKKKLDLLRSHTTSVDRHTSYHGSLSNYRNHLLYKFFLGDTLEREETQIPENLTLSLVISHCNEDMAWMQQFLMNYDMKNVTIYSKCNVTINGYYPPGSVIKQFPNVGRCDHTYAHWMTNNLNEAENATDNHLVIFLKASRESRFHRGMRWRPLHEIVRIAVEHGFACGYEPNVGYYHHTTRLRTYAISHYKGEYIKSPYVNLGHWLDALQIDLPSPITPVCYGGNFAVMASQINDKRRALREMELNLTRGNSIEEGHFSERTWAGLLSYPLNSNQTYALRSIPTEVSKARFALVGSLKLKNW